MSVAARDSNRQFFDDLMRRKVLIFKGFITQASGFEPRCRGFESLRAHHYKSFKIKWLALHANAITDTILFSILSTEWPNIKMKLNRLF